MPDKKGLHAKLAEVMAEAGRIPKKGKAPAAMGGFEFVQVGDAADAIRNALGTRGVSMLPTSVEITGETEHATKSGGTMTTLTVRTTWTLTDGDTGESAVIQSIGTGADSGDKASPKAQTNAMKYALLMGFLLSTGDDPELQDSSDRRRRAPQQHPGLVDGDPEPREDSPAADGSLIGTVAIGKPPSDLELRYEPDGVAFTGFSLTQGRGRLQVVAVSPLAEVLQPLLAGIVGQRVSVWGNVEMVPWKKDGKDMPPYKRLQLARIQTEEWTLPAIQTPQEPPRAAEAEYVDTVTTPAFTEAEAPVSVTVRTTSADARPMHGSYETPCGWALQPKSGAAIPCTLGEMHAGEHSWTQQAIEGGGRVVPPVA